MRMRSIIFSTLCFLFIFLISFSVTHAQTAPGGVTSNLELWLRATDGVLDLTSTTASNNETVKTWLDQTSNNFEYELFPGLLGAVDPILKDSAINFNPAIYFEELSGGGSSYLKYNAPIASPTVLDASGSGMISINSVFLDDGTANADGRIFAQDLVSLGARGFWLSFDGSDVRFQTGPGGSSQGDVSSVTGINTPMVLRKSFSNSPVDKIGYTNGLQDTIINPAAISPINVETLIGRDVTGYIPEVFIYDATVSEADGQKIDSYMAIKYGVTLDNTDTSGVITEGNYILSSNAVAWPNANTVYHNDITVIARDDAADLDQRISKSVQSDNFITLSTNSNFTSPNTSSARTAFSNDQSYFSIGNDNGSIATWNNVGNVPADYYRIDRQWRNFETTGLGTVHIQVDIDDPDADLPVFANGSYYLIVDMDQDADLTDETPILMTNSSGSLWRTSLNFPKETIFTIGAKIASTNNSNNSNPPTRRRLPELMNTSCDNIFTKFMRRGDAYDPEITKVQDFLNHHMGVAMQEDSIFGYQTEAQVKDFQARYLLRVDGIVGPETLAKLNEVYCLYKYKQIFSDPTYGLHGKIQPSTETSNDVNPILMYGIVSDEVKVLQEKLNNLGFTVARFGMPGSIGYEYTGFGRSTESAVRRFQKSYGIYANGIVNDVTRRALGM